MKHKVSEKFVQDSILAYLSRKGWNTNLKAAELHQKGCDIIVTQDNNRGRRYFIECKGKSYALSARQVNETQWVYALGQIATRMTVIANHAYKYGLGLPEVSARIALRRIPPAVAKRICLHIFSVNNNGEVSLYYPKDFKN